MWACPPSCLYACLPACLPDQSQVVALICALTRHCSNSRGRQSHPADLLSAPIRLFLLPLLPALPRLCPPSPCLLAAATWRQQMQPAQRRAASTGAPLPSAAQARFLPCLPRLPRLPCGTDAAHSPPVPLSLLLLLLGELGEPSPVEDLPPTCQGPILAVGSHSQRPSCPWFPPCSLLLDAPASPPPHPHFHPCVSPSSPPAAVPGEVHAAKEYGLLCDLEAHADVVGLVAPHQVGGGEREAGKAAGRGAFRGHRKRNFEVSRV